MSRSRGEIARGLALGRPAHAERAHQPVGVAASASRRTPTAGPRSRGGRTRAATAGPAPWQKPSAKIRSACAARADVGNAVAVAQHVDRRFEARDEQPARGLRQRPLEELVPAPRPPRPAARCGERPRERSSSRAPDPYGPDCLRARSKRSALRLGCALAGQLAGALEHGLAGVVGLQHGRVAGLAQDLAHQPLDAGERQLGDQRAVLQLLDDRAPLALPAGALGGDPDARDPRRRHRAGDAASPRGRRSGRSRAGARSSRLEIRTSLDPVEAEVARVVALEVVAEQVPALAPVHQRVRLDRALGELVLVLLVVVERQQARARRSPR